MHKNDGENLSQLSSHVGTTPIHIFFIYLLVLFEILFIGGGGGSGRGACAHMHVCRYTTLRTQVSPTAWTQEWHACRQPRMANTFTH